MIDGNVSKRALKIYLEKQIKECEEKNASARTPDDYRYWLGRLNSYKEMLFDLIYREVDELKD